MSSKAEAFAESIQALCTRIEASAQRILADYGTISENSIYPLAEEPKRYLAFIRESTQRVLRLIEEIKQSDLANIAALYREEVRSLNDPQQISLNEYDEALRLFLQNIAHDLRTPTVAIVEASRAIIEDMSDLIDNPQRTAVGLIHTHGTELGGILAELISAR